MNNDNNDDRDNNDSADQRTLSSSESGAFRKEPTFSLFDNDTELEVDDIEAEDFASDYPAEGYDDGPFDDEYTDETDPAAADDGATSLDDPIGALWVDDGNPAFEEQSAEQSQKTPWDDEPEATANQDQSISAQAESAVSQGVVAGTLTAGGDQRNEQVTETTTQTTTRAPVEKDDVDDPAAPEEELPLEYTEASSEDERWEDETDYDEADEDYDDNEYAEEPQKLPIGLIIVALVALALLAAGGYGVIKERAAAEAELTELRARLATAVEQQDIQAERDRARGLESENARLLTQLDALTNDNTALSGQVVSLNQQLEKAAASVTAAPVVPKANPQPVSSSTPSSQNTATPAPTKTAASSGTGDWFVNFGSYSQRAKAQEWADRLKPDSGSVIVAAADSSGASIYRVRIIGLGSKVDAQRIAAQLERTHGLSKLWVGQQ